MAKSAYKVRSQVFAAGVAQKLLNWLLVTLVLSLGFGQLLRFKLFGLPTFFHDLLVIIILPLLITHRESNKPVQLPLWAKLFLAGLVLGWLRALTLFSLQELLVPSLYSLRLLAYLALYLFLKARKIALSSKIFIISAFTTTAIGLAQYLLMPDMRLFQYLGWDDHLHRLTLPHFDPTFTGIMLVIPLLALPALPKLLYPLNLLAMFLTYSRSVWLSLVITLVTQLKKTTWVLTLILVFILGIWLLPNRFGEGTNLLRTYSISDRLTHDSQLSRQVGFNFVTGLGYNTLPLLIDSMTTRPEHASSFNNTILTVLATTGILGLIGIVELIRELAKSSSTAPRTLTFILVASLFNNVLLYPFVLLWLLLYFSLTVPNANSKFH